ncbi:polymeric immunoglobulin receptor-like [Silurus asotus]|nr:polymeric immunoglobulin receptor-like [Silurus asotus]
MKKCFRSSLLLLAVSVTGVLLNAEVYEMGSEDEAAVIKCPYREQYKTYPKYFCKGIYKQCRTLIETDGKTEWVIEGNLSLNDNKEKNMFVVTISNLSAGDTGTYGCGFEITGQDPFTVVHLMVMKAVPSVMPGGVRVKAPLGGNATIHCSYDRGNENSPKYFSKGQQKTELARLDRKVTWSLDWRFSLEDDTETRVFTVTMRNLSVDDAGVYWCGVDTWLSDIQTEVTLNVVQHVVDDVTTQNAVPSMMPGGVRVKAPLGGNATIHCSYDQGNEKYPKYFSKGQQKTELVRQDRKVTWSLDWRFSLEDDTETRVFTVTMRNLSVDDAGVYWCGVDKWLSDIQTEVTLNVVQHVVDDVTTQNVSVTGVLLNAEVYEMGSEDEAAVIKCPYREHYKTYPKYFCKGFYKQCRTLIKTDGKTEWVIEGNLSLNDHKEKNMFVVTINNLSAGDAGTYGCGIKITGQDPFTIVHLTVMKAEKPRLSTAKTTVSTPPTTAVPSVMPGGVRVKAPLGGNATIHCSYDRGNENSPKYFSKGQQKTELARLDRKVTWSLDWRFSLEDDTETRVFTVTMRNLSVDDAGVYWCGVDTWLSDIQTEVTLNVVQHVVDDVTTQNAVPSVMPGGVRVKAPLGGNATIHCSYDRGYENNPKYFSKGQQKTELVRLDRKVTWSRDWRFSLEDDLETRVFTVTMRNLIVDDAGVYWCGVDTWLSDIQTEVNLDVVQHVVDNVTTQNDTEIWQSTTEPQDQQSTITASGSSNIFITVYVIVALLLIIGVVMIFYKQCSRKVKAPGSSNSFITVYVIVALLLIIGVVMIFYKQCSRKVKGDSSPVDGGNPVIEENACYAYYEEPKDTLDAAVYAMAQNPQTHPTCLKMSAASSPNTDDFYSMAELPKIEINSYDLPTYPCNYLSTPSNLTINSSDLPTNLSD